MCVEGRIPEVTQQDKIHAVRDRGREGRPLARLERGQAFIDAWKRCLRAHRCVAVTREMLGRRQHVRGVDSIHHGAHGTCDRTGARAIAPAPHNRARAAAYVRHRAEVEVEAEPVQRACHARRVSLSDWHRRTRNRADRQAHITSLLVGGRDQAMP